MKFLVDMDISPKAAVFLRSLGYEAKHLSELGLNQMQDPDILLKARYEGHILLTHDLGFGELVAASSARLPSVITFRLRNMSPGRVNYYLKRVLVKHQDALEQGAIITVTEARVRVRPLPIIPR